MDIHRTSTEDLNKIWITHCPPFKDFHREWPMVPRTRWIWIRIAFNNVEGRLCFDQKLPTPHPLFRERKNKTIMKLNRVSWFLIVISQILELIDNPVGEQASIPLHPTLQIKLLFQSSLVLVLCKLWQVFSLFVQFVFLPLVSSLQQGGDFTFEESDPLWDF